jgi:hypothetical protein
MCFAAPRHVSWGRHSCLLSAGGGKSPPMGDGEFSSTRRRLPHWRLDGATYFLTFRLTDVSGQIVRDIIA